MIVGPTTMHFCNTKNYRLFEKELKSKTILMGFGLDSDAIHSPNEHFGIWNYLKGIETIPYFYKYFTDMSMDLEN